MLLWTLAVVTSYVGGTIAFADVSPSEIDRGMQLAFGASQGRLDADLPAGSNDTVSVGGRTYQVTGPLPIVPHLLFVPFPALWAASRWIVGCGLGIFAAWLALPLARRYAGPGPPAYWVATLGAFGTLLFDQSIAGGDVYYLAHVEAMLLSFAALIEFAGRRRPWVVGIAFGLAFLARPTLLLAAIPFGLAFAGRGDGQQRRALFAFALPILLSLAVAALYNALRFGSPLETGYGISTLTNPVLSKARSIGVLSLWHVPDNLAILVGRGFDLQARFPYLVPNLYGHSILLTSPALLISFGAGLRRETWVLWAAAGLVTMPLLLYYGGGGWQTYGFRYFLDAVPFLLALVALAARDRFGAVEKGLIVLSVGFVSYLLVWVLFH